MLETAEGSVGRAALDVWLGELAGPDVWPEEPAGSDVCPSFGSAASVLDASSLGNAVVLGAASMEDAGWASEVMTTGSSLEAVVVTVVASPVTIAVASAVSMTVSVPVTPSALVIVMD
jgi:hypothetical protein